MAKQRSNNNIELLGKIPPQAIDLEEAVLGALILENKAIDRVYAILTEDVFYKDAHRLTYRAIAKLYSERNNIDLLTVMQKAIDLGVLDQIGGAYALTLLTNRVTSSAHLEYHCKILVQKYIGRLMIHYCGETFHDLFDDQKDVFETIDKHIGQLNHIQEIKLKNRGEITWARMLDETMADIEHAMNDSKLVTGITTGDTQMNELTCGWQNGDLIILGGRPSMGKTALALHYMMVAVKHGYAVKFYSLEMSYKALAMRILSDSSEIDFNRLRRGQITGEELMYLREIELMLGQLPICINDNGRMNVFDISADARITKLTKGLDMIFIDYLGLVTPANPTGKTKEQMVSEISRESKLIAKELNVPVMELSQLSRANENSADKRPQLSNLRDSGSIEQDADVVIFPYRPTYYTKGDPSKDPDEDYRGLLPAEYERLFEVIIAKNRNGKLGTVKYDWDGSKQKFKSI